MPAEYNHIFAAGKRFSGACVTLVAARLDSSVGIRLATRPRLGLALAKKQIKRSHERNRVKRLLRESFRANSHRLAGLEFIAMAKTAAQKTPNPVLILEIERLISRAIDFFAAAPKTAAGGTAPAIASNTTAP